MHVHSGCRHIAEAPVDIEALACTHESILPRLASIPEHKA